MKTGEEEEEEERIAGGQTAETSAQSSEAKLSRYLRELTHRAS